MGISAGVSIEMQGCLGSAAKKASLVHGHWVSLGM